MELLTVKQCSLKQGAKKAYLALAFSDGRKANYFFEGPDVPDLLNKEVDVAFEKNGEYWNIKSLIVRQPAQQKLPLPAPQKEAVPDTGLESQFMIENKLECVRIAAGRFATIEEIISGAEAIYDYVSKK